jgi:hypothetical protein
MNQNTVRITVLIDNNISQLMVDHTEVLLEKYEATNISVWGVIVDYTLHLSVLLYMQKINDGST